VNFGGVQAADLAAFGSALARASALVMTAPVVGDRTTPPIVKAVVAAMLAAIGAAVRPPIDPSQVGATIPFELAIGLVAGLSARIVLAGVDVGGQVIGLQMGIGIASQLDPALGDEALPTRRLLAVLAGLAFVGLGGLDAVVRVVAAPPPSTLGLAAAALDVPTRAAEALTLGVRIAAPLILAGTIASLTLALASRTAPQVNLFSIDLALRAGVAIAVLIACGSSLVGDVGLAARRSIDLLGEFAP
jgi:flagellar biosynthetic protein FliR